MFSRLFLNAVKGFEATPKYASDPPFPHAVMDGVFEDHAIQSVYNNFPKPDESWWKYDNALERKFAKDDLSGEHFTVQEIVAKMQSRMFVEFIEKLTGIEGLIVDHTLRGGGLHQIARGGKLDIHADYNVHPVTKLDRRVNVLLYLNPGWKEEWGGTLELWSSNDSGLIKCERKVVPTLGRLVVFSTTDNAFHGHPDPLNCPEGITRKSIALYYYTNGRPESERSAPHSTIYKKRPGDPEDASIDQLRAERAKGRLRA